MNVPPPNAHVAALPPPPAIPGPHSTSPNDLLLHLGEAWYQPAPAVREALANLDAHRYPDTLATALRTALANYCGAPFTPANILPGNGSDGLIDLIARAYAGPSRPVAAPAPTFFVYATAAHLAGAPLHTNGRANQADNFTFDVDAFLAELPPTTGVIFLASPNNPTGDIIPTESIRRIAATTQALVVVDECYHEFAATSAISLLADHPNVLILRSLSKNFALAGLRVGYAVAHPDIIATLARVDQTFSINAAAQAAAVAALHSLPYYEPLFARTIELRTIWTERLTALGLHVFPSRANILLAEYPTATPLAPILREHGIHVADFHHRSGIDRCIRVTIDELPALARLEAALNH